MSFFFAFLALFCFCFCLSDLAFGMHPPGFFGGPPSSEEEERRSPPRRLVAHHSDSDDENPRCRECLRFVAAAIEHKDLFGKPNREEVQVAMEEIIQVIENVCIMRISYNGYLEI